MRLPRHAAQRVQTMCPETIAKSFHLLPLIAFCTAAARAAQAPRLRVSAHEMPVSQTKKASRVRPGSLQTRSSTLRPRESTHEKTTHDVMRIVSSAAAKAAQAPPSLFCDPILRQHKLPAPSAGIGGVRQMQAQPLRDTRRGRLAGGREAGGVQAW